MTQVDVTELTAYWYREPLPGEKSNCIVQLHDGIVSNGTRIVLLVASVPLNVAGSAVVDMVGPDTLAQLSETLSPGGELNCLCGACQLYIILHVSVSTVFASARSPPLTD